MEYYEINGGRRLAGQVVIHGAKNSVLPLLCATALADGVSVLHNCPSLSDVEASIAILRHLGCRVTREGTTVTVDASCLSRSDVPDALMREMRSSIIFLGAILARTGEADVSMPGGCELGPRPIDLHLSALRKLGAGIEQRGGRLRCTGGAALRGAEITLTLPSVGATENIMLCACAAEGVTVIRNAAREPEIVDLARFLCAMGAHIQGEGSSTVRIEGGRGTLRGCEHRVIGDRIVCATYLSAVACAGGEASLIGAEPEQLAAVTGVLRDAGAEILATGPDALTIRRDRPLEGGVVVRTSPYPGFPTDAQPVVMAALCNARRSSLFVETMFENRYRHVDELRRMGADIRVEDRVAVVGVTENGLRGAAVTAHDLRGGGALCVAALGAEGPTILTGLSHIRRGYASLPEDLRSLGADIALHTDQN